jgi:hypothetical protein
VVILAPYCNGLLEVGLSGGPGPGWDGGGQGWIYMVWAGVDLHGGLGGRWPTLRFREKIISPTQLVLLSPHWPNICL